MDSISRDSPFATRVHEFANVFDTVSRFLGISDFRNIPCVSRGWKTHLGKVLDLQTCTWAMQERWELRAKIDCLKRLPGTESGKHWIYLAEKDRFVDVDDLDDMKQTRAGDWVIVMFLPGRPAATYRFPQYGRKHYHRFYAGFHYRNLDARFRGAKVFWLSTRREPRAGLERPEPLLEFTDNMRTDWRSCTAAKKDVERMRRLQGLFE